MAELNGKQGVWRTVGGRKIFIVNGQDLPTAMKLSGKFKKKYTKKDIKKIYGEQWGEQNVLKGYELNGIYLLKKFGSGGYFWMINKKENDTIYFDVELRELKNNGTILYPGSYEEGIKKLIEFANEKNKRNK